MIDELLNSEYNNAGELFGLDAVTRMLRTASPQQQAQVVKKVAQQPGTNSRRSRAEMEKQFKQLPPNVKAELVKGGVRLADYTIYSIKQVVSRTIKMFEPQDDKEVGVRNISNAKLPKNTVFMVSGIYLLAGSIADADKTNPEAFKGIKFQSLSQIPAIANGEFSLKANRKQIIPENQAVRRFITDNDMTVPLGYYKLDNPRMIKDEELIEFTIELGTQFKIPDNTWMYVALDGTMTTP